MNALGGRTKPPSYEALPDGQVSFWWASLLDTSPPTATPPTRMPPTRMPLGGSTEADVCIVGGGFTGLWTAYYLKRAAPWMRVVVLEAAFAGFGASGRNGGWLSGLMPGDRDRLARGPAGVVGVKSLQRQLYEAVDEVLAVCRSEGIDAGAIKGGSLRVASTEAQLSRMHASLQEDRRWEVTEEDLRLLGPEETASRVRVHKALGSVFTPHCARVQPAKLVQGLALAAERVGVEIYEATPVTQIMPGRAQTVLGDVRARFVLRATEGFTAGLRGHGRDLLPMNSSMVVTETLPADMWADIGWSGCETLADMSHVYVYAQRTLDGRIALGGRGVPYRFGSRTDHRGSTAPGTADALATALHRLFPATRDVALAHSWCGVLGVSRDWCASIGLDATTGMGWAGGYVGDGVTASNLAGRTLADLVLGQDTERTTIPWVGHRPKRWEPEPFRWAGVSAIYALYRAADRAEGPGATKSSYLAKIADRISGKP